MIRFFSSLRRQLIAEGKLLRYFYYALGEILLVVIGILIALQINNQNEARKIEQRVVNTLIEIQQDLVTDVRFTQYNLDEGLKDHELMLKVVNNEFTRDDYLKPENILLPRLGLSYDPFEFQTSGYNKLSSLSDVIPDKYAEITSKLNTHYQSIGKLYNRSYANLDSEIKQRYSYLMMNHAWFNDFMQRKRPTSAIDFFISDPIYKNWVSWFINNDTMGIFGMGRTYHWSAVTQYFYIYSALGQTQVDPIIQRRIGYNLGSISNEYVGDYQPDDTEGKVKLELVADTILLYNDYLPFFLIGDDQFKSEVYGITTLTFERDKQGNISQMTMFDENRDELVFKATKL